MTRKNINLLDNYVDKHNKQLHIRINVSIEFAKQQNLFSIDQSNCKYDIRKNKIDR